MAKGEVVDFLKKYYRRLHTGAMDYDVLARLVDNKKKGILTPEQQSWFDDGFIEVDNDPHNKLGYRAADPLSLTDTEELHSDELIKLYKRIARDMYNLKSASALWGAKDKDVKDFINHYVDDLQLFPMPTATAECESSIRALLNLLDPTGKTPEEQQTINNIKQRIVQTAKTYDNEGKEKMVFTGDRPVEALDKFIREKLLTGKYNTDSSVQTKLKAIAAGLYNNWQSSFQQDDVTNAVGGISSQLAQINQDSAFDIQDASIDPIKLDRFSGGFGREILDRVYTDKDVRAKFAEKDQPLVDIIEKNAEGKISYQDSNSENYLSPKTEDVLSPAQQIEKWATDTYKNTIRKYSRLRGDPLLFSGFSKEIFKAIDKIGVKPTDGLDGLLNKANDVKGKITNKTVIGHFDWFITTMTKIKNKYPKAVEGAWKNAEQMKCVISEIILEATGPKSTDEDMEKAKTAMEIMTAMKYGMMTSKVMDALKKEEFSIFSDGKLSWNKNEGIQFVTKAFDKGVKAAFLGVGYGITFARNQIFMRNMKISNKYNTNNPALSQRIANEKNELNIQKANEQRHLENDRDKRRKHEDDLRNLDRTHGINARTITARERDRDNYEHDMNRLQANNDIYERDNKVVNKYNTLQTEIHDLKHDLDPANPTGFDHRIAQAEAAYRNPASYAGMPTLRRQEKEAELYDAWQKLIQEKTNATNELANKRATWRGGAAAFRAAKANVRRLAGDHAAYENAKTNYEDLKAKTEEFHTITDELTELNTNIRNRENAIRNWGNEKVSKVVQLENFWNFLQTGKTKTWRLRTDKAQEKFDKNKDVWLQQYIRQHGLAA